MGLREVFRRRIWLFAAAGSVLLWLAISVITGGFRLESIVANGISASFLAIPAIGQMIVVTTGRGAIDLSIPGVITLSAYLTTGLAGGSDSRLVIAAAAVFAVSAAVGLANASLVLLLRIPPIIATLAMGYILTTASLLYNHGFAAFSIAPLLTGMIRKRLLGVPYIVLFVALLALAVAYVLQRTAYGRMLSSVGQNIEAAYLSGIRTSRIQVAAYVGCSLLAGLAGMFISAMVGGAFLGMGDSYMMETVGAVVIGGTLIFGGKASTGGTLAGAMFLVLASTAMQIAGLPIGGQNIIKGLIIVVVLLLANKPRE